MKATVEQLRSEYAFSERRACRLVGLAVSTYRYQQRRNDTSLREQLMALAREKPRATDTGGCTCCCGVPGRLPTISGSGVCITRRVSV
jgi:hypothetical protein